MLAQKKADRVAAYRVCQRRSNQLKHLTGGALPLKKFLCDDPALAPWFSKSLRMCTGGVIRFVDKENSENQATVDLEKLSALPVLVLGMDQGSPGMAAAGWLHGCLMAQFYDDPFHRLARDMKGAVTSAPSKLMSLDLGVQIGGEDMELLFDSLSEIDTFRNKKSCVKSGRWFSWQNCCADHFGEFWATRMLLTFLHPDEKSKDDRSGKTFAELRQGEDEPGAGGLRLALRCTSWETWYAIKAVKIGGNPLWDFYARTVKEVKTPEHGLARTGSMALGDACENTSGYGSVE
eukprot:s2573_g2.t1